MNAGRIHNECKLRNGKIKESEQTEKIVSCNFTPCHSTLLVSTNFLCLFALTFWNVFQYVSWHLHMSLKLLCCNFCFKKWDMSISSDYFASYLKLFYLSLICLWVQKATMVSQFSQNLLSRNCFLNKEGCALGHDMCFSCLGYCISYISKISHILDESWHQFTCVKLCSLFNMP